MFMSMLDKISVLILNKMHIKLLSPVLPPGHLKTGALMTRIYQLNLLYTFFTAKSREKAFHPGIYPFSASQRYSVESLPQEKTQPSSV